VVAPTINELDRQPIYMSQKTPRHYTFDGNFAKCTQSLTLAIFLNTEISQDSEGLVTHLRYGEMFNNDFIANLLECPSVRI